MTQDNNEYKEIDREIKCECREAKEVWLNKKCEVEQSKNIDPASLHKKIKKIAVQKNTVSHQRVSSRKKVLLLWKRRKC